MLADMNDLQNMIGPSGFPPDLVSQASDRGRAFISARRTEVMSELTGPAPAWPAGALPFGPEFTLRASFTAPWGRAVPQRPAETGTATLELSVDGQAAGPFTSLGAYAVTNLPPSPRARYPGIVITAVSGSATWRLTLTLDPMTFGTGVQPVDQFQVRAQLSLIEAGRPARNRNLGNLGELRLDEAVAAEGGTLRGSVTLKGAAFAP